MFTGKSFNSITFINWTFWPTIILLVLATIPTALYAFGVHFISIPWQPIALFGTALSFVIGLKNNSSYSRTWEARQIYGAIINDSRSFGYTLRDALKNENPELTKAFFSSSFCLAYCIALSAERTSPMGNDGLSQKSEVFE